MPLLLPLPLVHPYELAKPRLNFFVCFRHLNPDLVLALQPTVLFPDVVTLTLRQAIEISLRR